MTKMKDSGERQSFATGAVRDTTTAKPRPDLISPLFALRLGEWLRLGAEKYSARNWEKGIPNSRCHESLCRHLAQFAAGCKDEDHAAAVAFNIMAIIHNQVAVSQGLLPPELLDFPPSPLPPVFSGPCPTCGRSKPGRHHKEVKP